MQWSHEVEKDIDEVDEDLMLSRIKSLEENLKKKIYSQDEAIKKVVQRIKIAFADLGEDNRPIGSFLFTGPTGVGKTELAKELAKEMDIDLIRFDMSEFPTAEIGIAKLIGSAPGYANFQNGGLLTNAVAEKPFSVVVFDEIEKADPNLMSIFLQILDNAQLTDAKGEKICFKTTIIIMTSNLGVKSDPVVGFSNTYQKTSTSDKAIKQFFSPEFINRLDGIISFNSINNGVALHIVDKYLDELKVALDKQDIHLSVSEAARKQLAKLGYSKEMGARSISRAISSILKVPITEEILNRSLKNGSNIDVSYTREFKLQYNLRNQIER